MIQPSTGPECHESSGAMPMENLNGSAKVEKKLRQHLTVPVADPNRVKS